MKKKKSTPRPQKVMLTAIPKHRSAYNIVGGTTVSHVFVSTYRSRDHLGSISIMCGFSAELDPTNAFPENEVASIVEQWIGSNGRGWKFWVCDVKGDRIREHVVWR